MADALAALSLCSTEAAVENLGNEGLGDTAVLVGDVMADVALIFGPIADERSDALERLGLEPRGFIAATAHRAGNVDDPANLRALVEVLARAAETAPVVFAVHPRTRARLEAEGTARRPRRTRHHRGRPARLPRHHPAGPRLARGAHRLGRPAEGGVPRLGPLRDDARGDRVGGDGRDRVEPPGGPGSRRRRSRASRAAETRRAHLPSRRPLRRRRGRRAGRNGSGRAARADGLSSPGLWQPERSGSSASGMWGCRSASRSPRRGTR